MALAKSPLVLIAYVPEAGLFTLTVVASAVPPEPPPPDKATVAAIELEDSLNAMDPAIALPPVPPDPPMDCATIPPD